MNLKAGFTCSFFLAYVFHLYYVGSMYPQMVRKSYSIKGIHFPGKKIQQIKDAQFCFQNKTIAEELYAVSWYEMPPMYRKDIFLFLTLAQKSFQLYGAKVFPISLEMFPDMLESIRSNVLNLKALYSMHK